jgi:hypothetical protein
MSIAFDDDGHARRAAGLYYVGLMSDEEQIRVETHLAACPTCLAEYEALGEVVFSLSSLPADSFPDDAGPDESLRDDAPGAGAVADSVDPSHAPDAADRDNERPVMQGGPGLIKPCVRPAGPGVRFVIAQRRPALHPRPQRRPESADGVVGP